MARRINPFCLLLPLGMLFFWFTGVSANPLEPDTIGAEIIAQYGLPTPSNPAALVSDRTVQISKINKDFIPDLQNGRMTTIDLGADGSFPLDPSIPAKSSLFEVTTQVDPDPLLNLRLEIFNPTTTSQSFSFQIKIPTDITIGPTFNNTFANIELFDDNQDGITSVSNVNTFFEVIDDPLNGGSINGSRNLGQSFFYSQFSEGKQNLFDNLGSGPNSDDFMGDGFNFLRFNINGTSLSPGDSAVITAMGCYSNDQNYCAERYEIPASVVPLPAAVWFLVCGLVGMFTFSRRNTFR